MGAITHILAAMAGGLAAIGGYAVVKIGAEQERRYERMREVERLLMELLDEVYIDATGPDKKLKTAVSRGAFDACVMKIMEV